MASIRRVIHKSGRTSWQARWRDPAGAQHAKDFNRRVGAQWHLTTVEARKLAGTYVDPRGGRLKLGESNERTTLGWLNRRDSSEVRDDSYPSSLILPTFANMSLGVTHPTDMQQWVAQLDTQGMPRPRSARHTNYSAGSSPTPYMPGSSSGLPVATSPCHGSKGQS